MLKPISHILPFLLVHHTSFCWNVTHTKLDFQILYYLQFNQSFMEFSVLSGYCFIGIIRIIFMGLKPYKFFSCLEKYPLQSLGFKSLLPLTIWLLMFPHIHDNITLKGIHRPLVSITTLVVFSYALHNCWKREKKKTLIIIHMINFLQ